MLTFAKISFITVV